MDESVSFRGIVDGGARIPLRKFWGKLDSYLADSRAIEGRLVTYVNLNFSLDPSTDIIETTEPYQFPVAQISIPLNKRRTSLWTILADSAAKHIKDTEDIGDLVSSRLLMEIVPHDLWNAKEGKSTSRDCWEVHEIVRAAITSQAGGVSPTDRALELLDSCATEQEWNQKVFQDNLVKSDMQLLTSIMGKTFLPAMEAANKAWKDENGWHTNKG